MTKFCQTCEFYRFADQGSGRCVRYPPQVLLEGGVTGGDNDFAVFPRVKEYDRCGEFKQNANPLGF